MIPDADAMFLQYTNHSTSLSSNLATMLQNHMHCDVVLACKDGLKLSAHKIILSACSKYFRDLLADTEIHQETIIVLRDINRRDMKAILDFLYSGEVKVPKDNLSDFLSASSALQVSELNQYSSSKPESVPEHKQAAGGDIARAEVENTHIVKIEPQTFLDVMESENIETIVNDTAEDIKIEPHEMFNTRPEGAGSLQIRTDILSSGSVILTAEPHPPQHHHTVVSPPLPDPQINFPETAQELVRNRIFGWNQKRALVGLESAEKILTKKPCVCTQCGARFSYRNQLTEHKRTAHD